MDISKFRVLRNKIIGVVRWTGLQVEFPERKKYLVVKIEWGTRSCQRICARTKISKWEIPFKQNSLLIIIIIYL